MSDNETKTKGIDEIFCSSCGSIIKKEAEICPKCGVRQRASLNAVMDVNTNWLIVLLLSIFLGTLGIDRFYVGKIGTGILKLLTGGGCGIWWIIDIILIVTNQFTDSKGNYIRRD